MAIETRNGQSYFWSLINDLFDQDIPNRENFIKGTIHKLQDGVVAGRDLVFNLAQQLGSTNAGTSAVQRGTVVMGTIAFSPVGDLDGKTLILQTDLAGPVTVTFAQPISPAHAATQINTQAAALGLVASVDTGVDPNTGGVVSANVGKLLLVRPSGGTASLTVKGAGTANALLGLPLIDTTITGTGTVNDGASRIGLAAFGSWAGGTLQAFLLTVADAATTTAALATKVAKGGDTITGALVFSGATARVRYRPVYMLPNTSTSIGPTADVMVVPVFSGASITYTVKTSTSPAMQEGDEITIINRGVNTGDSIIIAQEGGGTLATLDGGDYGFVVIGYDGVGDGDPTAYVKYFGSEGGTTVFGVGTYPLP